MSQPAEQTWTKVPPINRDAEESCLGAMLLSRTAIEDAAGLLRAEDFSWPKHAALFAAIVELWELGESADPVTVSAHLDGKIERAEVAHIQAGTPASASVRQYAQIVAELATYRRLITAGGEIAELGYEADDDAGRSLARARELLESADLPPLGGGPSLNIAEFLAGEDDPYDWVIPGALERGERALLVALEGLGKSVLLRQWAIQLSQGIHPWRVQPCRPMNVMIVDLENARAGSRRLMRPVVDTVREGVGDEFDPRRLRMEMRPEGIDVTRRGDQVWLYERVAANRPDLLVIGPIYKLHEAEDEKSADVRQIQKVLDRIRQRFKCALLMETHAPHDSFNKGGKLRPAGSRLWIRWPEFILGLVPQGSSDGRADLTHVRRPRYDRQWPDSLERGGRYPWTPPHGEMF